MRERVDARAGQPGFVEVLDTGAAEPAGTSSVWGDLVQLACGPVRVAWDRDRLFRGVITRGQFGTIQTSLVQADAHSVERDGRLVERADNPPLYICAVLDGEAQVRQDDCPVTARAGDLMTFDSSSPYVLEMYQPIRMVSVKLPHRLVGLTPGGSHPLRAASWSGRQGVSQLLLNLLEGLADQMTEVTDVAAERLGDSVHSLISAVLDERLRGSVPDSQVARRALLLRIQQFARENLGDPALSPALLARRHGVSLRYLQVLFNDEDASPARWIRDERLARCKGDLVNPRFAHLTVAAVGERWGLPGASHFSRLFRERYDLTPRDWRRAGRVPAGVSG